MPIKNIIPGQTVTKEKLQRAKELRRDMTPAEKILWREIRGNKLGVHFRRQQVIAGFIVDFYCHKAGLVIEVDGDIHDLQQEEDARREKVLREMGLRIVRNHISCAILVWVRLKQAAYETGQSIYQVKHDLLSDYLRQQLRSPSVQMVLV